MAWCVWVWVSEFCCFCCLLFVVLFKNAYLATAHLCFCFWGFSLLRSLLLPLFSDLFAIIIIIILSFCYNASSLIGWCARAQGYRHWLPQLLEELWFRLEDQHLIGTALRAVLVIGALVLVIGCERCGIINHGLCLDIEHEIRMCARIYVAISPDSTISLPLI